MGSEHQCLSVFVECGQQYVGNGPIKNGDVFNSLHMVKAVCETFFFKYLINWANFSMDLFSPFPYTFLGVILNMYIQLCVLSTLLLFILLQSSCNLQ